MYYCGHLFALQTPLINWRIFSNASTVTIAIITTTFDRTVTLCDICDIAPYAGLSPLVPSQD